MEQKALFVAFTNQKGGVGKSVFTVIIASYLHYVKGRNVAIIDCDYPQHSLSAMRDRDIDTVNNHESHQQLLTKQYEKIKKKAYTILKGSPETAIDVANNFISANPSIEIVLFDFPGTVGSAGVLSSIMNMDFIFVPIITDKIVMQSSLAFALGVENYKRLYQDVRLKSIYHFWNKVDQRENKEVYNMYKDIMERLHIDVLSTEIPDSKKFNRELSFENRPVFRSTLFPPDRKLLRGSKVDNLVKELIQIINQEV